MVISSRSTSRVARFMTRLSRFVLEKAGIIALVGTLFGGVGLFYTVKLYKNLRTGLELLLPESSRSVVDLEEVTSRLNTYENLNILIFSKKKEHSKQFVIDLAERLEKEPRESRISSVEYKVDRELAFFSERKALYIDLNDLKKVRDYVQLRLEYEGDLHNPLNIFSGVDLHEPSFDFDGLQKKYEKKTAAYTRFPDGFYATSDELQRVMIVNMAGKAGALEDYQTMQRAVLRAIQETDPKKFDPEMEIRLAGTVQNVIEEQESLMSDLGLSSVVVGVCVSAVLLVFFRTLGATCLLLCSLLMGLFWTFGLSYLTVGYLNANSAFLGSIIVGNGINFGVLYLARYLEERRRGFDHVRSTYIAVSKTTLGTWTAALAAGFSYGSLMLTHFRGFNQFGLIGLIGMVFCWFSAYLLLPAYLTLFHQMGFLRIRMRTSARSQVISAVGRLISTHAQFLWFATILVSVASVVSLTRWNDDILESSIRKMRSKQSLEKGSGYYSRQVDEIFGRYLSPMVVLPRSLQDTKKIGNLLKEQHDAMGNQSVFAAIRVLDDFVPSQQGEKIQILNEIRKLLPPKIMWRLSEGDQKRVKSLLLSSVFEPFGSHELPALVVEKFTEHDGTIGRLIVVEPPITEANLDRKNLHKFVGILRQTADKIAPGTPVAGGFTISNDLIVAISRDGPIATLASFLAVVLLVVVLFRNTRTVLLCLFALVLGVLWLAGFVMVSGMKINFLNFIALPITFGIGVDYGVNIFSRYLQEGSQSILRVLKETGGAVALCSTTTIIGYSSLLLAENQAFNSFGAIAIVGELTCLAAALISLPSFLVWSERRRLKKVGRDCSVAM